MPGWAGRREYSREFHRNRVLVRRRSGGICEVHGDNPTALPAERHGARCTQPATSCDHIHPQSQGGTDALDNLQDICTPHHKAKTTAEATHGRALRRSMARRPTTRHPGLRNREDF
ncbi:HNH endonuclease [Amycolatopsis sp. NPDC004368]